MSRFLFLILLLVATLAKAQIPTSTRADSIRKSVWPQLQQQMKDKRLKAGAPVFLRIFKQQMLLEVWVWGDKNYRLFKSYPICYFSGGLGTKTTNGDCKSPEGFYTITPKQLNPVSNYHLAINVGYPNKMEMANHYTGNAIMIHGHCASIGCYAMTDPEIDEIYTIVYHAFAGGQKAINLHILPFKMDEPHMQAADGSPYLTFWRNLKQGYDAFEQKHIPPDVSVKGKAYAFAP